jgi:hypothetical protein
MRRNRRGGGSGLEFGGSGEDSFVAVVVTKLTGALLFILLLAMVIMALLPKAADLAPPGSREDQNRGDRVPLPLSITTPETLPEAIAGRPYSMALAAIGGRGPLRWTVENPLPEGLSFDPASGVLQGTPAKGTPQPLTLNIRVSDGSDVATTTARLLVYQSDQPLVTPAWWKPGLPPVPWRAWLDQGVGFLLIWLVHCVGMGALKNMERSAGFQTATLEPAAAAVSPRNRYAAYRMLIRLCTASAIVTLVAWLRVGH